MIAAKIRHLLVLWAACIWGISATAQEVTFELSGVTFTDSSYLTEDELQGAIAPYMNRPNTFDDVQAMMDDVRRLYTASGIVTADVLLMPQDVADGILKLDLVEAAIGEVAVVDVTQTNADFLRDRISLNPGERPDYTAIQQDMRIFELAYDVRPRLTFSPGDDFGVSDVAITVAEPDMRSWTLSVDNFAAESLGRWQATLGGRWHSLTGQRDTLSYSLGLGEGISEFKLGYDRPVGMEGAKVTATLGYSRTQVVDGTYAVLDVVTDKADVSLGYQMLAGVRPDSYWRLSGNLRFSNTTSTLLDTELQDRSQWEVSATAMHNRALLGGTLDGSITLTYGASDTGDVASTDGDFQLLTGTVQYGRAIAGNWVGELTLRGQFTDMETLPASKLFTVGGLNTMRGYPDGILSGITGVDMRMQVVRRPFAISAARPDITIAPFAFLDAATIQPVADDSDAINVASAGLGIRGAIGERTSVLATIAQPLREVEGVEIPDGTEFYIGLDYDF